jgi:putative ABC transport system substrate-binding protein
VVEIGRRGLITLLGGGAAAWPVMACARQASSSPRRIAVLLLGRGDDPVTKNNLAIFQRALRELGWIEGRNIAASYGFAAGDTQRMRAYAAEFVRTKPEVIFTVGAIGLSMLRQETRSVPIVFAAVTDPVAGGFVESLGRPGGNITGFTNFEYPMAAKWLELLKEIAPRTLRVGFFQNPQNADWAGYSRAIRAAAASLAVEPIPSPVADIAEIERAMSALASQPHGAFVTFPDAFLASNRQLHIGLAAKHHLPGVYPYRYYAQDGGLLSYGPDLPDLYRRAPSYIDRILKGEKPADLPVQAPVKYDLVLNLKTAKALDLDVPWFLQQRADEVIE